MGVEPVLVYEKQMAGVRLHVPSWCSSRGGWGAVICGRWAALWVSVSVSLPKTSIILGTAASDQSGCGVRLSNG